MNDIIVELGVENALDETAFNQAVEAFAKWREETSTGRYTERYAPDLIVKTIWSPQGALGKKLIFQDQAWADRFMAFWRQEVSGTA